MLPHEAPDNEMLQQHMTVTWTHQNANYLPCSLIGQQLLWTCCYHFNSELLLTVQTKHMVLRVTQHVNQMIEHLDIFGMNVETHFSWSVLGKNESKSRDSLQCKFCPGVEKLFIAHGAAVGLRKDLNGVLLLDSILQPSCGSENFDVILELTLSDVCMQFLFTDLSTCTFFTRKMGHSSTSTMICMIAALVKTEHRNHL